MMTIPKLSEMDGMRVYALVAIVIITLFLAALNVTGAWVASGNFYYTGVVLGVELLAAACLVLILDAPTKARKIVGSLVFAALIYVCVENGKMAIEESFEGIFTESSAALREKAKIANADAADLKTSAPEDRNRTAEEIAALRVEQNLMKSDTRPGIKEAQISLKSIGAYTGPIDGLREQLTEDAMLKRGEQIRKRLEVLQAKADAPTTPASDKSVEAVELNAQANKIDNRTIWMNLLLFAVEGARSAGLWAFVVWTPSRRRPQVVQVDPDVFRDLQAQADELARRKANLETGAEKAVRTKGKKKKVTEARQAIEDFRTEMAKREADQKRQVEDAIAEMTAEYVDEPEMVDEKPAVPPVEEPSEDAPLDLTDPVEPERDEPTVAEEAQPEPGTDLVPYTAPKANEEPEDESKAA